MATRVVSSEPWLYLFSTQMTDISLAAIQAPLVPPPVHPNDRKLLRPLGSLGKPKTDTASVSFLRRTQYTADEGNRIRLESNTSRALVDSTMKKKKKKDESKEAPINILRNTIKGFDVAYPEYAYKGPDSDKYIRGFDPTTAEFDAWKNPKHPTNPHLKLIDSYPLLPDLDAFTDSIGYVVTKFAGNPTNAIDAHDERMDVALLRPLEPTPQAIAERQAKEAAHEADPIHNPEPGPPAYNYEVFIPDNDTTAKSLKRKFDVDDPMKDDPKLYTGPIEGSFRFNHLRVYETGLQSSNTEDPYKEVAITFYDPSLEQGMAGVQVDEENGTAPASHRRQKAAYYYPIISKYQLKPRRNQNLASLGLAGRQVDAEADKIDNVDVRVGEPDEEEEEKRAGFRADVEDLPEVFPAAA